VLYGRDAERARILQLIDRARQGKSGAIVVSGEAGVGKSALLDDARRNASDVTTLFGRGIESEAHVPYAGLHQLVRPVLSHLDHLPDPQARALRGALGLATGASDEWFLVSLAVLSLLAEAAEERPLLVLVDDAHWLDDATAESLVFAARRFEAEGIAMVFAAREGDIRSFDAPGFEELRIGGLDTEAAERLLASHITTPLSADARRRLIEGTGGNPLALLELCPQLSEGQLLVGDPVFEPLPVSARVQDAFLARVRELAEPTQTLLLVAAVDDSGDVASILRAGRVLGAGPEALDAAEAANLVGIEDSTLAFRHPLIRSAVHQAASFSQRQAAHRALADVLTGESNADRRAWHRAAACVGPDARVAAELEQAAERAQQRSGFVAASIAYERASAVAVADDQRLRLLRGAVKGAWYAGRLDRARTLLMRARPLAAHPTASADLDNWRGLIELNAGVPSEACELFVQAGLDIAGSDPESALYSLSLAAIAAAYSGDGARVPAIAEAGRTIPRGDSHVARFLAEFLEGTGAYFAGSFDAAIPHLRSALSLAAETEDEADAATGRFGSLLILAGGAALFVGDDRVSHRLHRKLVARARESGAMTVLTQAAPRLALSEVAVGQWAAAVAGLRDGLELARQSAQHQVLGHMLSVLALVAALQGNGDECRQLAAESRELAAERGLQHVTDTARWALTALEIGEGNYEEALVHARAISIRPMAAWSALDRIESAARAGDAAQAREWLDIFAAWARASEVHWAHAVTLHCEAVLADDPTDAESLFADALVAHAETERPYERARTELALGELLRRARRRVEARDHLRAALDGFETLGATLWSERARTELRASGQTARTRTASTRNELTPQELQVARFVARGLNNREVAAQLFLSPRTIDFHLRNVFRKLGITSRMQLPLLDLDDEPAASDPAMPPVRA
jgi:DNA-binding CsgD family transcriptional regulator